MRYNTVDYFLNQIVTKYSIPIIIFDEKRKVIYPKSIKNDLGDLDTQLLDYYKANHIVLIKESQKISSVFGANIEDKEHKVLLGPQYALEVNLKDSRDKYIERPTLKESKEDRTKFIKFTTEQKEIAGYTFKEMGKDSAAVSGDFTDKAQTVTYVYTKDKVNTVTPTPADNKPGHKEDTPKTEPSSSTHDVLPETGENEKTTFISIVLGISLVTISLVASVLRVRKNKCYISIVDSVASPVPKLFNG